MADTADNWVENIGKSAYESIAAMVAALNCDYDRLNELIEERAAWGPEQHDGQSWALYNPDACDELYSLLDQAGECKERDDADQRIQEDPLSIEVRSGWTEPGQEMVPEEFCILLGTGGPAVRIHGELDERGEPYRAWLEVQDWGKPWTEYFAGTGSMEVLVTYAQQFVYVG